MAEEGKERACKGLKQTEALVVQWFPASAPNPGAEDPDLSFPVIKVFTTSVVCDIMFKSSHKWPGSSVG